MFIKMALIKSVKGSLNFYFKINIFGHLFLGIYNNKKSVFKCLKYIFVESGGLKSVWICESLREGVSR
jgi:hypothetical protein